VIIRGLGVSRLTTTARNLLLSVVICVAISSDLSWALESCHVHPPGKEPVEPEFPRLRLYSSLDECESANAKYFGGAGRCHCFPDFMNKERSDIWNQPRPYIEMPRNEPLW
jgi:hypothetical protein